MGTKVKTPAKGKAKVQAQVQKAKKVQASNQALDLLIIAGLEARKGRMTNASTFLVKAAVHPQFKEAMNMVDATNTHFGGSVVTASVETKAYKMLAAANIESLGFEKTTPARTALLAKHLREQGLVTIAADGILTPTEEAGELKTETETEEKDFHAPSEDQKEVVASKSKKAQKSVTASAQKAHQSQVLAAINLMRKNGMQAIAAQK